MMDQIDGVREHAIEQARRVVALPSWRWMPGMVDLLERRVVAVDPWDYVVVYAGGEVVGMALDAWASTALPALSDPATLGCVLALGIGLTETEAAVLALEAAP